MNDQWTDRLSEYVDGELASGERAALEAHLATCADCRATLEQLRKVVARAKALEDRPPTADLWPGVAQRIGAGKARDIRSRRFSFNVPQLIAASIVLMLLAGGSVWLALRSRQQAPGTELALFSEGGSPAMNAAWTSTDVAVAELQDALTRNEGRLDTATVRVVRQNLAVIDKAIGEAQRALKADPGNAYLNLHLANTMHQKIELLRRANALAARES